MKILWRRKPVARLAVSGLLLAAAARGHGADKSGYSLANPVPAELLRDLNSDRPDVTEGPFTVDAGHAQLEMDFASYAHNRLGGTSTSELSAGDFNLRMGVRSNFEAGIFIAPYMRDTAATAGEPKETNSGFGDVTLRAKINFWGNDGGATAGGLIVDLTLPTAARGLGSGHAEGTVTLPLAVELGGGWDGGAMTVLDLRPRAGGGYRAVWINAATVGHDIAGALAGYMELTSAAGDGGHAATFDAGLMWKVNANTQLDAGANFGLTRNTDDVLVFSGLSRRF